MFPNPNFIPMMDIPIEKSDESGVEGEVDVIKSENDLFEDCEDPEPDNAILDFEENLTNIPARIPIYKPRRLIGESCIKPATGFQCDICQCFLISEVERLRHLKSQRHYNAFVTELNKRAYPNDGKKDKKKRTGEETDNDDTGNWKRRKVDNQDDGQEKDVAIKNELYDPSEPSEEPETMEDDDVKPIAQENGQVPSIINQHNSGSASKIGDDDDVWQEVDNLIENAKEDEREGNEVNDELSTVEFENAVMSENEFSGKTETESTGMVSGRATRRTTNVGNVRNGAGPKSKRGRKSQ